MARTDKLGNALRKEGVVVAVETLDEILQRLFEDEGEDIKVLTDPIGPCILTLCCTYNYAGYE